MQWTSAPTPIWPLGDLEAQKKAEAFGTKIRAIIDEGLNPKVDDGPHTYLNYANGVEAVSVTYGRDADRVNKLQTLKKTYDPQNRFRWYNPIIRS